MLPQANLKKINYVRHLRIHRVTSARNILCEGVHIVNELKAVSSSFQYFFKLLFMRRTM